MKIRICIFLVFSSIFLIAGQNRFFYNKGERIDMVQNPLYVSVKFNGSVDESIQNMIIQSSFGSYLDSKSLFKVTQKNRTKSNTFLVRLKEDIQYNNINNIIAALQSSSQVKYIGMGFSKNDKIVHFATDELIVKFKKNTSSIDIRNLSTLFNTSIVERVYQDEDIYLLSVNSKGEQGSDNVFDVSNKFSLTQFVEYAQPNFIRIGMLTFVPNDSLLPMQWNIHNTGNNIPEGIKGIPGCDLNLEPAWDLVTGNHNVIIGIIDTGVDTSHIDLVGNLCDRKLWYNAVDENPWPADQFNHGTAMSGIAAAIGNNVAGTCGVAWHCSIMPVKVFSGEGYTTDLILGKGLNWAWTHGAEVLNNSWGGGVNSPFISNAILNAKTFGRNGRGTVVFAATGNNDSAGIFYPSVLPEVIAVGGVSPCCQRKSPTSCDLENWGANYGEGLSVVSPTPKIGCTTIDGLWHFYCNGTSSACPQITAIGAMILSKNINLSADSVRMIIERSARKVGAYSYNISKPNGMWNNEMGYGFPDARACLQMTPQGPSEIYDQIPPVVKITPPQSGWFSQPIVISANITDNQSVAGGNNAPRLYYNIISSPVSFVVPGVLSSPNTYSFIIPQNGPGFSYGMSIRYYLAAQDTSSNGNIATYPPGGSGINPPGSFAPPKKLFLQNTHFYDTTVFSTEVPINFAASVETTVVSHASTQIYKTLLGVRCLVNIDHNYDEDISVSLISPSGTETVLTAGLGKNGQNYSNTYFDDYAPNSIMDTSFHAPYTGIFSPVEKLWFINGENSNGIWTLKIVDNSTGDVGRLNQWSITLRFSSDRDISQVPQKLELVGNFPNPFNPITRITFNVPYRSRIKVVVYDLLGREVYKVLDEFRNAGFAQYADFDLNSVHTYQGSGVASGIYFYSLFADDKFIEAKRMAIVK